MSFLTRGGGYSSLSLSFKNSLSQGHKILSRKTRDLEAAHGKDFVISACIVLTQYSSMTDGRTDAQAMAKMHEAFCYSA